MFVNVNVKVNATLLKWRLKWESEIGDRRWEMGITTRLGRDDRPGRPIGG